MSHPSYRYRPGPVMKEILAAEGKKIPVKDRKWRDPKWRPDGLPSVIPATPTRAIPTTWADMREQILSRLEARKPKPQPKPSKWPVGTNRILDSQIQTQHRAQGVGESVGLLTEADEAYNTWLEKGR